MVEEGEQAPVNQPGSVLELVKRVVVQLVYVRAVPTLSDNCDHYLLFNQIFDLCDFLHYAVPVGHQDLACKLSPRSLASLIGIRGLSKN